MAVEARTRRWTLEELQNLPDDGNKYELVHGELLVTPPPAPLHQRIIAALSMILFPYVAAHRLGQVHTARAVIRRSEEEVEPDLYVGTIGETWEGSPAPVLVVEVLSDSTKRRDLEDKRAFYMDRVRVPEYWIVDPGKRSILVIRPALPDEVVTDEMSWHAAGAAVSLTFGVGELFR